ncbi:MAG: hypothetical protein ACFFCZ_18235 [Promethearchaeota archaeon]
MISDILTAIAGAIASILGHVEFGTLISNKRGLPDESLLANRSPGSKSKLFVSSESRRRYLERRIILDEFHKRM